MADRGLSMEDFRMVDGASMTRASPREKPNVVVTIFSQIARTYAEWRYLTARLFEPLDSWIEDVCEVLDLEPAGGDLLDPLELKGNVYEIRGHIHLGTRGPHLTWEYCKTLREWPNVQIFQQAEGVEIVFQPFENYLSHRTPGLAVFDMDSTLIQQEVIDELAREAGCHDAVAAITEAAMRGELDFEQSLRQRVAQLGGVSTEIWDKMKKNVITFTPGAFLTLKVLHNLGWKTAVLSGGFTPLAFWVQEELGMDYAFANQLAVEDGKLTGELVPGAPIIHANEKRDSLHRIADLNKIPLSNTIAVGDGSNDLLMIEAAGMGIAYNAKPKVQAAAPVRLNSDNMLYIMYLLGYTSLEVKEEMADEGAGANGANGHIRENGS